MKKLLLTAAAVFAFGFANAQETKFGLKAGLDAASIKAKFMGVSASSSETGFYVGGFANIGVSDKFSVQPEALYIAIEDFNMIQIPVLAKVNVSDKFGILAGPDLSFMLDAVDGMKSTSFGANIGASYDVSDNFLIDARYNIGLSNLVDTDVADVKTTINGFFIGVGYKF